MYSLYHKTILTKAILNNHRKVEIIYYVLFDHNEIKVHDNKQNEK